MDDETRPLLQYNLNHHGFAVIIALNQEDAIERVKDGRAHVDLILLNQVESSLEAFMQMGQTVRQTAGLDVLTPIVVVADRYDVDMEGTDLEIRQNEFISYPRDAQQLLDLLDRLCKPD